jgi:hypothetical protein
MIIYSDEYQVVAVPQLLPSGTSAGLVESRRESRLEKDPGRLSR